MDKEQYIREIYHDLNNLMASIRGYAEFLTEDLETDSEPLIFAQKLLTASEQAQKIIEKLCAIEK